MFANMQKHFSFALLVGALLNSSSGNNGACFQTKAMHQAVGIIFLNKHMDGEYMPIFIHISTGKNYYVIIYFFY